MKKSLFIAFVVLLISIAACQQAAKETVMEKKEGAMQKTETTSDVAVDAVGKDLNNVDSVEKDLSTDELSDLDSGLNDVENI